MSNEGSSGLHISGIVVALTLLMAWIFQERPLTDSRPVAEVPPEPVAVTGEDVPARLWQDPFDAIRRYQQDLQTQIPEPLEQLLPHRQRGAALANGHGEDRLEDYLAQLLEQHAVGKIILLPVMVTGGPYAENREHRLRTRYAVLAALANAGYTPVEGEHIGFWRRQARSSPSPGPSMDIPYEAFLAKRDPEDELVLVLWLKDELFQQQPLRLLDSVVGEARDLIDLANEAPTQRISLRILGPAGSGGLQIMTREAATSDACAFAALRGAEILCAAATVPEQYLLATGEDSLDRSFQQHGINLLRTIVTDRQTADALLAELQLRGVDPVCRERIPWPHSDCGRHDPEDPAYSGHLHHIVLISESDTLFGRTLPRTFIDAVKNRIDETSKKEVPPESLNWLHRFSYIRGLDGKIPGAKPVEQTAASSDDAASLARTDLPGFLEPAVGTGQLDYLRRLAAHIETLDRSLKSRGQGSIRAFGILGSDVYDKLLILQALRERFPNHLYFTTDLDARYLNPRDYKWTRNLVVASGFDLNLSDQWQQRLPPFRSVYQSAYFFATTLAVRTPSHCLSADQVSGWLAPRVFEIGRNRFFELSPPPLPAPPANSCLPVELNHVPLYPPAWRSHLPPNLTRWGPVIAVLGVALLLLIFAPLRNYVSRLPGHFLDRFREPAPGQNSAQGRRIRPEIRAFRVIAAGLLVISPALPALLIDLVEWIFNNPEPFVPASGVSIWPSEMLRLFAAGLSLVFVFRGWNTVRGVDRELIADFDLPGEGPPAGWKRGLQRMLSWFGYAYTDKHPQVRQRWREYLQLSSFAQRTLRILITGGLFYAIGLIILYGIDEPPLSPHRGEAAFWFSTINGLLVLGIPFLALLFGTLDEMLISSCFIRYLSSGHAYWGKSREKFRKQFPKLSDEVLDDWITVRFLARRTEAVGRLIYYPFIVLMFILLSLSTRFDNWDTPAGVLGVIALCILVAGYSAVLLRHTAQRGKNAIVGALEDRIIEQRSRKAATRSDRLDLVVRRIKGLEQGAFGRWYNEPAVKALAWVLGIAAVVVSEYIRVSA